MHFKMYNLHVSFNFFVPAEVSEMSSRLSSESRIYAHKAKDLSRQVWIFS
jgi:hypothetical protein